MKKTTKVVAWAWITWGIVAGLFALTMLIAGNSPTTSLSAIVCPLLFGKWLLERSAVSWWAMQLLSLLGLISVCLYVGAGHAIYGTFGLAHQTRPYSMSCSIIYGVFYGTTLVLLLADWPSRWRRLETANDPVTQ